MSDSTAETYRIVCGHLRPEEVDLVDRACRFAIAAHAGQKRVSGEAFVTHPLAAAQILADLELDAATIAAAVLHDTVEDTTVTLGQIAEHFGPEIALLVDGVTVTKIDCAGLDETANPAQKGSCRKASTAKFLRAVAADRRVAYIRFADRLHNLRTARALPREKQQEMAHETLATFVPLAMALGIRELGTALERLSLAILRTPRQRGNRGSRLGVVCHFGAF